MFKQAILPFVVILSLIISSFLCGCDDDRPNGPVQPKDYPVYFCDSWNETPRLFTFYPIAKRVDSVDIPWNPDLIKVSADGYLLYIYDNNYSPPSFVVRADDLTKVADLPGPVFGISPDNQFIAISKNGVKILRTSDYSIVFEDSTLPVQSSVFSFDGGSFYCNTGTSVYKVALNELNYPIRKIDIIAEGGIVHVLPSLDETKLFLNVSIRTWLWAFEVYDVLMDSIIFRDYLVPGYGHMAISPDGEYVFYTNPGRTGTDPPSQLLGFKIFNVKTNQIGRVVVDTNFCRGLDWVAFPSLPVVTPDSRWLVILGSIMHLTVLYSYDIESGEFIHREDWGGYNHFFIPSLAVQYFR